MPTDPDAVLGADAPPAGRNFNKQENLDKEMVQWTKSCHANLKTGVQISRTHTEVLWAWQSVPNSSSLETETGIPRASWLARPLGSSKLQVEREREQKTDRQIDRDKGRHRARQRRETERDCLNKYSGEQLRKAFKVPTQYFSKTYTYL